MKEFLVLAAAVAVMASGYIDTDGNYVPNLYLSQQEQPAEKESGN